VGFVRTDVSEERFSSTLRAKTNSGLGTIIFIEILGNPELYYN
jgi:hypothetical protein